MNLTQTVRLYRLVSKIALTFFLLLVSFRVSTDIARFVFPPSQVTPTPVIPIEARFGLLPPLEIQGLSTVSSAPSFRLDLIEATLPVQPEAAKVFPIVSSPYGFLSLDRVRQIGQRFFFSSEPTPLAEHEYMFSLPKENLRVDDEYFNLSYNYDYRSDSSFFSAGDFVSRPAEIAAAENVLQGLDLLDKKSFFEGRQGLDLVGGERAAVFAVFDNQELVPTEKISQAQALRVDFYRQALDDVSVVEPRFFHSQTFALLGGKPDPRTGYPRVLGLDYTYWVLDQESVGVYPLISSGEAWQTLQQKPEYVVALRPEGASPFQEAGSLSASLFSVKEVFLGYYNSSTPQPFLQPVWVFKGKANLAQGGLADWAAYVPAVSPEYLLSEATAQ